MAKAFGDLAAISGDGAIEAPATMRRTGTSWSRRCHRRDTEHGMLRYLRRLADRDLALIATTTSAARLVHDEAQRHPEMASITRPEFADLHPFAPDDESVGTRRMISELEGWLAEITGYHAVSVQPNAGSQGELAGLLAIRALHRSRGEHQRTVCRIRQAPTAPTWASVVMAGFSVRVVATDAGGDIDVDDLRVKLAETGDQVGAINDLPVATGIFEEHIGDICVLVHDAGGQVYIDGANLNALVGLAKPGRFGADVSHLNLHKTFCIPHGGGGPGVGPVAVREHSRRSCPATRSPIARRSRSARCRRPVRLGGNPQHPVGLHRPDGTGRAAPRHRRGDRVGQLPGDTAREHYPVLYAGAGPGSSPTSDIDDLRGITKATGVTVDDVAKRLDRLRVPRPDDELPGGRHPHDRAHRERDRSPSSTASARR